LPGQDVFGCAQAAAVQILDITAAPESVGLPDFWAQDNVSSNRTSSASHVLSEEQNREFLDETAQLRRQLNDKRFDYREAVRNPGVTREDREKPAQEMESLQTRINKAAERYK